MVVAGSTFVKDSVLFVRDLVLNNVTDPVSGARTGNQKFVYTSYPERDVRYPIITVRATNFAVAKRLGLQSEQALMTLPFEVRVWAKNEEEKDKLSQDVFNVLKNNQFETTSGTVLNGLYGFKLSSAVDVDEPSESKSSIKSKVMEYSYSFIG